MWYREMLSPCLSYIQGQVGAQGSWLSITIRFSRVVLTVKMMCVLGGPLSGGSSGGGCAISVSLGWAQFQSSATALSLLLITFQ